MNVPTLFALLLLLPSWTRLAFTMGKLVHHAAYVSVWTDASLGDASYEHRQRVLYAVQASSAALVTLAWACGIAAFVAVFPYLGDSEPEPTADACCQVPESHTDDGAEDSDAMVAP